MRGLHLPLLVVIFVSCGCGKKNDKASTETKTTTVANNAAPPKLEPSDELDLKVKKFLADIKAGTLERRMAAIDTAVKLEGEGAELINPLLDLLKDPTSGSLGDSSYDRPKSAREAAVHALIKLGPLGKKALVEKGLKVLQDGLSDAKPTIRERSAMSIGVIGADAKAAVPSLLKLCTDKESAVRSATYRSLERVKNVPPIEVVKLLGHADPGVCLDAAQSLTSNLKVKTSSIR
jgi:HEAT repeat protein